MPQARITYADKQSAEAILHKLYPAAKQVRFIEHGYDNLVGLVDELYAVRFPRKKGAYARSLYEKRVLEDIQSITSVNIPKVLGAHDNPPYLITSYLKGNHLDSTEVNQFPLELQSQFAERVALFAYEFHSTLSVEEAREIREELRLDEAVEEPWDIYLKKMLLETSFPIPEQDRLAKQYHKEWVALESTCELVVVHDDLHTQNMLFEDSQLTGILDFGDTNIGTPEQELRQLYRINESVMSIAADTYSRLSGTPLNKRAIIVWAIVQELAVYAENLSDETPQSPAFHRACKNLNKWLPHTTWRA